jgi:hypothetical protein
MGQWLIADVSFLDIHLQLWMLLVAGVVLLWVSLCLGNMIIFVEISPAAHVSKGLLHVQLPPHFEKLQRTARRFVIEHGDHQPPGIPSEGVKVRSVLF